MADPTPAAPNLEEAVSSVRVPAIFLMVAGAFNLLISLWLLSGAVSFALMSDEEAIEHVGELRETFPPEGKRALFDRDYTKDAHLRALRQATPASIALAVVSMLLGMLEVAAGWRMRQLRSRGLAVAASTLVTIPCLSPMGCFLLGEAVGLWCLVVLFDKGIRAAFAARSTPTPGADPGKAI